MTGYDDWKHLSSRIQQHEQSRAHLTSAYMFGETNIAQILDEGFRRSVKDHKSSVVRAMCYQLRNNYGIHVYDERLDFNFKQSNNW